MNRINTLFQIKYPIIQAGMIWCSNWELAAAVSNAGGLGIIGAGSLYPDELTYHIQQCQKATSKPFAVNVPLLYPNVEEHFKIIIENNVKIVFTSAGNPATWTKILQDNGITVVHVIANTKFALKCEAAGVDAIVCEGFEAGGHNGREETTTLCLVPLIRKITSLPLIAAGGIATGQAMLAVMALGAEGVQIGSRFVASTESSAHTNFKQAIIQAKEGDTSLLLKKLTPVRLLKNNFSDTVKQLEDNGATKEQLQELLGRARAKKGMKEGNLIDGELEIGQVASQCTEILPAATILHTILEEYHHAKQELLNNNHQF